ncbi:atrial natriuretic peptide receptor 1-like [Pomacea canaliculata]|uniref:atrial natriuretic peptide receptor 1-like n=1 Tax=Pomacea canaliculata TaxID=400727 RepID=UPI000D73A355|nr:atrial natriuretic peptide receptor 1-like [Pomacea canaliculata]
MTAHVTSWRSAGRLGLFYSALVVLLHPPAPASGGPSNLTMGIFLPLTGAKVLSKEGLAVVKWTVEQLNRDPTYTELRKHSLFFNYLLEDTKCDSDEGVYRFSQMISLQTQAASRIDAIIGPSCDDVCRLLGGQARIWDVPLISFGCESSILSDRRRYPTFLRTTGTFDEMQQFIEKILTHFGWNRLTLVHGQDTVWLETSDDFQAQFQTHNFETRQFSLNQDKNLSLSLQEEAIETRVFVLCAYGSDVITFMSTAFDLGLTNGDYAFISIDFGNMVKRIPDWPGDPAIFNGLLDITIDVAPERDRYVIFMHDIFNATDLMVSSDCASGYEMGIHGSLLSDAISLYAKAVNSCLADGSDPTNGTSLAQHLYGTTIDGVSGQVRIGENGSRVATFMLHNIQKGCYVQVARFSPSREMRLIAGSPIVWPGEVTVPPRGSPVCGWNNELCQEDGYQRLVFTSSAISATAGFMVVSCVVSYLYLKRRAQLQKISSKDWKIPFAELKTWREGEGQRSNGRLGSGADMGHSRASLRSKGSVIPVCKQDEDVFLYKGELVMAKRIHKKYLAVSFSLTREINQIRQLNHRNVNPLIGACVELNQVRVISMYAHKGSLYDVIHSSSIKLDATFLVSFAMDICKGMTYVHTSPVCYHGNLKSSNVLVDRSWTCKVGDFRMFYLREGEVLTADPTDVARRQFWTAPEVLREERLDDVGWQKADVYSYGIILYELLSRKHPYDNYWDDEPQAVIAEVVKQHLFKQPPFRPHQEAGSGLADVTACRPMPAAPSRPWRV